MTYADDEHFQGVRFGAANPVPFRNEGCTFEDCDFSGVDLRGVRFVACRFIGCELSNCGVVEAGFQEVELKRCKALGVRWDTCNSFLFSLNAVDSQLDYSCWVGVDLSRSQFQGGSMREADFTEVNGQGLSMFNVDVTGARWEQCLLKGGTFANMVGWTMDLRENDVRGMRVDRAALPGLVASWGLEFTD